MSATEKEQKDEVLKQERSSPDRRSPIISEGNPQKLEIRRSTYTKFDQHIDSIKTELAECSHQAKGKQSDARWKKEPQSCKSHNKSDEQDQRSVRDSSSSKIRSRQDRSSQDKTKSRLSLRMIFSCEIQRFMLHFSLHLPFFAPFLFLADAAT